MRELINLGLAIQDLTVFNLDRLIMAGDLQIEFANLLVERTNLLAALRDLRILACNMGNQITGQFAQLFCVQTGQQFRGDNHRR